MTKTEVNAILGDDAFHGKITGYAGMTQDSYNRKQVLIIYSEDMTASYIQVGHPFKVIYLGVDLMRMSLSAAKTLLENNGLQTEERNGGIICTSNGIDLYSAKATNNHLNSIVLFEDGYWDKMDAKFQEYRKVLARQVELWKKMRQTKFD
jgi:hypothetical protein